MVIGIIFAHDFQPSHWAISRCSAIFVKKEKKFVYSLKISWPYNPLIHSVHPRVIRMRISYDAFVYLGAILSRMLPWMCEAHEAGVRSARLSGSENSISVWTVMWPRVSEHLTLSMTASTSVVENKGALHSQLSLFAKSHVSIELPVSMTPAGSCH